MTRGAPVNEGAVSARTGMRGWPKAAEDVIVARDLLLAADVSGARYHVAHLSSARALELVRDARAKGIDASCEVTPHHLMLTDKRAAAFDTNAKMNPPLRTEEDAEALRDGLRDGSIDCIATDHAPHSPAEKAVEFNAAPYGIVGLETCVGLVLTELLHSGVIDWERFVALLSTNPRRLLRLPAIRIAEGESANLTIIDPERQWIVDPERFRSLSRNTPFAGRALRGRALGIVNKGAFVSSID
jgi:dihydroorotase